MDDWSLLPPRNASPRTGAQPPEHHDHHRPSCQTHPPTSSAHSRSRPPAPTSTALDPAGLARQPINQPGAKPRTPTIPAITALPTPVHAPERQHRATTALKSPGPSWMTQNVCFHTATRCWFATASIVPPRCADGCFTPTMHKPGCPRPAASAALLLLDAPTDSSGLGPSVGARRSA
jgi:hypothetical protein